MRVTLLALLLTAAAGPALAQSNAELMANDHYTRSHDYDLIHQRIAVSDFNWDSLSFEGSVTTTLVALRPGLDSVILDEGALLANTSVTDRRGKPLRTTRSGDTLVVFPASPVGFGDTLTFSVAYHGKVKDGDGLTYITSDGLPHRPQQIWSQGEDHNNHDWFPTFDFPSDKMTWEMVATVPAEDFAVSNGRLVSDVVRGGQRTVTWNQERAVRHLPGVAGRGAARQDPRHVAGHPGGLLRLPRRQRRRVAPVPRDAGHDRDLLAAHRHPLPVGQVRPDHRGRLLRRHGERERDHAGGLAPRRARRTRTGRGTSGS